MATFHIPISCPNTSGSSNFKVKYRLADGDGTWMSYLITVPPTSGTTAVIGPLLDNRIYDFQIQNLNGAANDLSLIAQNIGITDPNPGLSPTATTVGYSFANLSQDIDSYTVQLTTLDNPGVILATHVLSAGAFPGTISDAFTALTGNTSYRLVITPVANQFNTTFVHVFVTNASGRCPDVPSVTVTLT